MKNNLKDQEVVSDVDGRCLYVSCFDSIEVRDRTTFDSCVVQGIHVTFWSEDYEDGEKRINRMFDALFEEVVKSRDKIRV